MANGLYVKGAERIGRKQINFEADTLKCMLMKNTYPQNLATDEFVAGISAHRLGADFTLTGKTFAGGRFDANDPTWAAVAAGDTAEAIVIYQDSGDPATSPLLMYLDTITGFPVATNGGDIAPTWDNGTFKIMSLVP